MYQHEAPSYQQGYQPHCLPAEYENSTGWCLPAISKTTIYIIYLFQQDHQLKVLACYQKKHHLALLAISNYQQKHHPRLLATQRLTSQQ